MKKLLKQYAYAWPLLYWLVYLVWFFILDFREVDYTVIHCALDEVIPFCEYFIIPYCGWFLYVALAFWFFTFKESHREFYRFCTYLFGGMTICLIIYMIFPNGQDLRVDLNPDKNFCTKIVSLLQAFDSPTNVCPSIHVYNSAACHLSFVHSREFRKYPAWLRALSGVCVVFICLSTIFLKQHSAVDVVCGAALAIVMYAVLYKLPVWEKIN